MRSPARWLRVCATSASALATGAVVASAFVLAAVSSCSAFTADNESDDGGPGGRTGADAKVPLGDGGADAPTGDAAADEASVDVDSGCARVGGCGRYVFATSKLYPGNFGGVSQADKACMDAAASSTMADIRTRTFKAWLSTSTTSPSSTFKRGSESFRRLDQGLVAKSWSDLTDGSLGKPIDLSELETPLAVGAVVWTSTSVDGQSTGNNCNDWSPDIGMSGRTGLASATNQNWTTAAAQSCSLPAHLYCIEN